MRTAWPSAFVVGNYAVGFEGVMPGLVPATTEQFERFAAPPAAFGGTLPFGEG